MASYAKSALADASIGDHARLDILEKLHELTDRFFRERVLVVIEPMSGVEVEMMEQAFTLDRSGDKSRQASFNLLTGDTFNHFVAINPSLLRAIKLCGELRRG
jgi:hypothetical protein